MRAGLTTSCINNTNTEKRFKMRSVRVKEKKRRRKLRMGKNNNPCLWSKKQNVKILATMVKNPRTTRNNSLSKNSSKMNAKTHALTIKNPWRTKASNTSKANSTTNTTITHRLLWSKYQQRNTNNRRETKYMLMILTSLRRHLRMSRILLRLTLSKESIRLRTERSIQAN